MFSSTTHTVLNNFVDGWSFVGKPASNVYIQIYDCILKCMRVCGWEIWYESLCSICTQNIFTCEGHLQCVVTPCLLGTFSAMFINQKCYKDVHFYWMYVLSLLNIVIYFQNGFSKPCIDLYTQACKPIQAPMF